MFQFQISMKRVNYKTCNDVLTNRNKYFINIKLIFHIIIFKFYVTRTFFFSHSTLFVRRVDAALFFAWHTFYHNRWRYLTEIWSEIFFLQGSPQSFALKNWITIRVRCELKQWRIANEYSVRSKRRKWFIRGKKKYKMHAITAIVNDSLFLKSDLMETLC